MPRDVSLDNPALKREDDEFNRWSFSKRLADTIAGLDTSEGSPILGLFGKWGYGKSTVLNFLKDELEREHAKEIRVFEFNPWLLKDEETLLVEFFRGLVAIVGKSVKDAGKELGNLVAMYAGGLKAIPVVGGGLSEITESMGKLLAENSVQDQRDRVKKIMRKVTSTIVVLIDDLDRLDRDDIMMVLKLVRLSANFPHVVYVLAFDDEMVARAAGEKYGGGTESGRQFLEKIIQYPFSLPAIRSDRFIGFVLRRAREACTIADITLSEDSWEVFRELVRDTLSVRLGTPRQAIRYASALRFSLPMLKGEVDPLTQMAVEGLRTLFPELYAFARDRQTLFRENRKGDILKGIEFAMRESNEAEFKAGHKLLVEFLNSPEMTVFAPRYFDRYFCYTVPPEDLPETDVYKLLALGADEKPEFANELRRLAELDVKILLESISRKVPRLNPKETACLARRLTLESSVFAGRGFDSELSQQFLRLVDLLLYRLSEETEHGVKYEIVDLLPLQLAGRLLKMKVHSREGFFLLEAFCERLKRSSEAEPLYLAFEPSESSKLFELWRDGDNEGVTAWLTERLLAHPEEVGSFLQVFPGLSSYDTYDATRRYIDPEILSEILTEQFKQQTVEERPWIDIANQFLSRHDEVTKQRSKQT